MTSPPILLWFRRDFRFSDHAALSAAVKTGRPIIPVVIRDEVIDALGAAPKWRWGRAAQHFSQRTEALGSKLILRSGSAEQVLRTLLKESGARAVYWTRCYDPASVARDTKIKSDLSASGIEVRSFGGHLLFEPWDVETKTGGLYRVYSPFWRAVRGRDVPAPRPAPEPWRSPQSWPASERIEDWKLGAQMQRGADIVERYIQLGEQAAQNQLSFFVENRIDAYKTERDFPSQQSTSRLSENLSLGEISPHQCWHAAYQRFEQGSEGAEHFLKELVWREFAYHLMHHTPHILERSWRDEWEAFPWKTGMSPELEAWQRGRTGIEFVDAAMRSLYVTGTMHNRARMIVASYLTKHLMVHWREGQKWFEDCLTDWDAASNAMGWQWVAGSGPDAAPYFRVFNPVTQREKFDSARHYVRRWIAEGYSPAQKEALLYFDAIPTSWNLRPEMAYPAAIVTAEAGRKAALAAYESRGF